MIVTFFASTAPHDEGVRDDAMQYLDEVLTRLYGCRCIMAN